MVLHDLVHEVPLWEVARKYQYNKGTLQSLQQAAATFAGNTFIHYYHVVRVATTQGKQGISFLLFPDRENTGNFAVTQGKFLRHRENILFWHREKFRHRENN